MDFKVDGQAVIRKLIEKIAHLEYEVAMLEAALDLANAEGQDQEE